MSAGTGPYTGIGSRKTPTEILAEMRFLGRTLQRLGYVLRSGAAEGADDAFESGATEAGGTPEIYLPWRRFAGHRTGTDCSSLANVDQARAIASTLHPTWDRLTPQARAFMVRNVYQVLGLDLASPSQFVLVWAPNPRLDRAGLLTNVDGGSGLAVRLAYREGIAAFHLGIARHRSQLRARIGGPR